MADKHPGGRPTKLTDELLQKAHNYIWCDGEPAGWTYDGSVLPTIESFASYLLINRDTVYAWIEISPQFSDIVKEIKQQQASMLINGSLNGKYNASIAKLILSGKHGYVEKSATDITTGGEKISQPDEKLAAEFAQFMKDKDNN